jgi:hypothetical protein
MATPEQPLHAPQIYTRFLAGGPSPLRLSLPDTMLVVVGGLILTGTAAAASTAWGVAGPGAWLPRAAAATLAAWVTAALAARWLGSRLGALAGLAQLTSVHVLLPHRASAAEMLYCAAVAAAMGAFALANVPGRLPLVDERWTRWGFYAAAGTTYVLAGPVGPAFILAGCLLFLLLCADSRGARFFASPVGIAVFALLVAARLARPNEGLAGLFLTPSDMAGETLGPAISLRELFRWLAVAGLPWTPLAVLAVAVGLRRGHYATPIWRFLGCWVLGPLALVAVGGFRDRAQLGPLFAPLAVTAAAGLGALVIRCRRKWRGFRVRRIPSARLSVEG